MLLATLDVRNAFSKTLEIRLKATTYIMQTFKSYLKDRDLVYQAKAVVHTIKLTSGAAQGSILGLQPWNSSYDEIFNIEMPTECYLAGYADDVAADFAGRNMAEVQRKLNQVMLRTKE